MDNYFVFVVVWCYYCGYMRKEILLEASRKIENPWGAGMLRGWYNKCQAGTDDILDYTLLTYNTIGHNWKPEMKIDTMDILSQIAENKGMSKDRGPILEILKNCIDQTFDGMIKDVDQDYMVYSKDIKLLEVDGHVVTVKEKGVEFVVHIDDILIFHPAVFAYLLI